MDAHLLSNDRYAIKRVIELIPGCFKWKGRPPIVFGGSPVQETTIGIWFPKNDFGLLLSLANLKTVYQKINNTPRWLYTRLYCLIAVLLGFLSFPLLTQALLGGWLNEILRCCP